MTWCWTKFKDRMPDCDQISHIYVTDGKDISIRENLPHKSYFDDWYWSPVFIPELPKKELHSCSWDKIGNEWFCQELENGKLELVGPTRRHDRLIVQFCPFCGFSVGEE